MRPGREATARTASSTPGMNDARSSESWRMVSVSPVAAEQHLLVRDQPAQPHRVHRHAVDVGAARAVAAPWRVASGMRRAGRPRARAAAISCGGARRGAARRVDLVRVVQLDDLDRLEEAGRLRGEPHHQHRADGEVRRDEHADARARRRASARTASSRSSSKPVVPTTDVDAVLDAAVAGCP